MCPVDVAVGTQIRQFGLRGLPLAVMVVAGGQGMVLGPAVGSLVFTFVPELPKTATGKIQRFKLRAEGPGH